MFGFAANLNRIYSEDRNIVGIPKIENFFKFQFPQYFFFACMMALGVKSEKHSHCLSNMKI